MAQQSERLPGGIRPVSGSSTGIPGIAAADEIQIQSPEAQVLATRVSSPTKDAWRRFKQNWAALISLTIIGLLILAAIFAPFLHTQNPLVLDYGFLNAAPNGSHWFGTDGVGRDEYSRLLFGLRVPLEVGMIGAAITLVIGSLIGVISGYAGGIIDSLLSRFTDVMFAFPSFLLALISVSLFGQSLDNQFPSSGRIIILTIVFSIVSWPPLMRFTRSLAFALKEQQFVEAARTCGSSHWSIIRRHLLPNMWGLLLVQASFVVVGVIGTEAILSILGLGVPAPYPDLGRMLYDGQTVMDLNYWEVLIPSAFLTILILSFTFLGDGLRDAIDPRMNS
jgi:oligopeptide transport system permease protein